MNKIGFIGAGNMGGAIIAGASKLDAELFVCDKDKQKTDALLKYGAKPLSTIAEIAKECSIIFLAVKPQGFDEVLGELKQSNVHNSVIVSIAAGITGEYIQNALGFAAKVVLVMPNTPLLLGYGATAISRLENVSGEEFAAVKAIFEASGTVAELPAEKLFEIIPINGSSPAFIYKMAEDFINYGASEGIAEETSKALFAQALIGSAKMITDSGYDIKALIDMVSSKGGTTIAGLDGLREKDFDGAIKNCCEKCVKRAYELKK